MPQVFLVSIFQSYNFYLDTKLLRQHFFFPGLKYFTYRNQVVQINFEYWCYTLKRKQCKYTFLGEIQEKQKCNVIFLYTQQNAKIKLSGGMVFLVAIINLGKFRSNGNVYNYYVCLVLEAAFQENRFGKSNQIRYICKWPPILFSFPNLTIYSINENKCMDIKVLHLTSIINGVQAIRYLQAKDKKFNTRFQDE